MITNNPRVWALQILRLLDDAPTPQKMAEAGFAAFRARLSSDAAASRLVDFLDKLSPGPAIGDAILRQAPRQGACLVVPD